MAPIPSEAGAPQAGAAPAPGGEQDTGGGGKIASLMQDTFKNLAMLSELAGQGGDQSLAQKIQAVKAQFEGILDGGGEEQGPPGGAPSGPVPMMAGAAKVRPVL
jgi:hypothetical protein